MIERISFDFMGVVNFSHMYPEPDKTTMTKIEFSDKDKINEIVKNGIKFHAEFPQARNIQTVRVSVLSLFLSLFFSLLGSMSFKLFREKMSKIKLPHKE